MVKFIGSLAQILTENVLSTNMQIFEYQYLNCSGHSMNIVTLDAELYVNKFTLKMSENAINFFQYLTHLKNPINLKY